MRSWFKTPSLKVQSLTYEGGTASKTLTRSTPQGSVSISVEHFPRDSPWQTCQFPHLSQLSGYICLGRWCLASDPLQQIRNRKLKDSISIILSEADLWAQQNNALFGKDKTRLITFYKAKLPWIDFQLSLLPATHLQSTPRQSNKVRSVLFSLKSSAKANFNVPSSHFATIFMGAILPNSVMIYPIGSQFLRKIPT